MKKDETEKFEQSAWREKVYIETAEHIVCGYIYMPKIGKRTRLLSEVLNTGKSFLAVKNCTIEHKLIPSKEIEQHDFIEVNIASILIMRPF